MLQPKLKLKPRRPPPPSRKAGKGTESRSHHQTPSESSMNSLLITYFSSFIKRYVRFEWVSNVLFVPLRKRFFAGEQTFSHAGRFSINIFFAIDMKYDGHKIIDLYSFRYCKFKGGATWIRKQSSRGIETARWKNRQFRKGI